MKIEGNPNSESEVAGTPLREESFAFQGIPYQELGKMIESQTLLRQTIEEGDMEIEETAAEGISFIQNDGELSPEQKVEKIRGIASRSLVSKIASAFAVAAPLLGALTPNTSEARDIQGTMQQAQYGIENMNSTKQRIEYYKSQMHTLEERQQGILADIERMQAELSGTSTGEGETSALEQKVKDANFRAEMLDVDSQIAAENERFSQRVNAPESEKLSHEARLERLNAQKAKIALSYNGPNHGQQAQNQNWNEQNLRNQISNLKQQYVYYQQQIDQYKNYIKAEKIRAANQVANEVINIFRR